MKLKSALLGASVSRDRSVLRLRVFGERQRNGGKGGEKGALLESTSVRTKTPMLSSNWCSSSAATASISESSLESRGEVEREARGCCALCVCGDTVRSSALQLLRVIASSTTVTAANLPSTYHSRNSLCHKVARLHPLHQNLLYITSGT